MKTIKQIADEIGVTKQAIQKRLTREPLCTSLSPYISTDNGTKYIAEIGESLIKQAFAKNEPTTASIDVAGNYTRVGVDASVDIPTDVHSDVYSDIIKILQENLNIVQKQIEVKDKQIEELTETVRLQAESINADRKNELAETLIDGKNMLTSGDNADDDELKQKEIIQKKKPFFQRIFNKNKDK